MPKANPASAPAAAPRHRRVASPRTIVLATILACLPILAASQLLSHIRVDEFDSWLFAYFGRELAGGAELYVDVWDNKPPGIFWVNAFAGILSGNTLIGAAIATSLASAGACTVFFLLTRRLYGLGTAAIGTFLATVYLYTFYFHVGANRPSTFIAVTEIAAVLLYARALAVPDRMRGKNLALAGLVAGFGLWFKQSALAALAAMLCHQALLAVFRDRKSVV